MATAPEASPKRVLTLVQSIPICADVEFPNSVFTQNNPIAPDDGNVIYSSYY
jgi:hypothetical protein